MKKTIQQQQLEKVCTEMIKGFNGDDKIPENVDIDSFVTEYLGYSILYENIAVEEKLGFTSDGVTPLEVIRDSIKNRVIFPEKTIVIDKFYQDKKYDEKRRFILAHEVGHIIQNIVEGTAVVGFYSDLSSGCVGSSFLDMKESMSIVETKANKYAAAILMPDYVILDLVNKYHDGKKFTVYFDVLFTPKDMQCLEKIASILKVSYSALFYRLKDLGAFVKGDNETYVRNTIMKGIEDGKQ